MNKLLLVLLLSFIFLGQAIAGDVYLLENEYINPDEDKLYTEKGKWSTMMREVYESSISSDDERKLSKIHWEKQKLTRYLPAEYK